MPLTAAITGIERIDDAVGRFLDDRVLRAPGLVRHALAFLEIAAGAERLVACPGDHDAAQVTGIERERHEELLQIAPHLRVERVAELGTIESDEEEPVFEAVGA